MKRIALIVTLLAFLLISVFVWTHLTEKWENTWDDYEEAFDKEIPSDLNLTIYFMDPTIDTLIPVRTLEDLKGYPMTRVIYVDAEELAVHRELFASLNAACLKPIEKGESTDSQIIGFLRLVYILERGNGDVLLEVMATSLVYDDTILVNGFEVENNPIFYKLIDPYLTEDDKNTLRSRYTGSLP